MFIVIFFVFCFLKHVNRQMVSVPAPPGSGGILPGLGNDDDVPVVVPRRNPFGQPSGISHQHHHQHQHQHNLHQTNIGHHHDSSVNMGDNNKNNGNAGEYGKTDGVLVLPKALEDVFAFKDQLADQLGRTDGEIPAEAGRPDGVPNRAHAGVISGEWTRTTNIAK